MKLSIIIPVYNSAKYLDNSLMTLVGVDNKYCEFVFVDDGSTDNSKEIISLYMSRNKNIRYVHKENGGVSSARNCGISIATGKYIMFLDSDDYLEENWYNCVEPYLNSNYDMIIFSKNFNDGKINIEDLKKACLPYKNKYTNCRIMAPFSKLYLRKVILDNNVRFNTKIINGEDMLFNYKVLSLTSNIYLVNKTIYNYRVNFSSATNNYNDKINESNICFLNEISKLIEKNDEERLALLTLNGLVVIAKRISFSSNKNKVDILKNVLNNNQYTSMYKYYDNIKNNLSKYDQIILFLIIKNRLNLCMLILCSVRKVKKILYKNKQEMEIVKI